MGKICHECEDPSWTGQDPIVAPVLPSGEGGGTSDFNQMQNRPKYGGVEMSGSTDIPNIEGLIPTTASSENQLADKDFVNSSVATNTAYFVGTFDTIEELEAVENPSNNDYGFVISTDSAGNTVYNRYKFNSDTNAWVFEYALNNSSFTAAQWAAIQSGITSDGVNKLEALALIESIGEGLNLDANGELSFDKSLIGKARVLTTADYNWPTSNPTEIALWTLSDGIYSVSDSVRTREATTKSPSTSGGLIIIGSLGTLATEVIKLDWGTYSANFSPARYVIVSPNGGEYGSGVFLGSRDVVNNLTSTSTAAPLSANQGKVLKDLIDSIAIRGAGAPTTSTVGEVGQLYEDGTNGALYQLKSIDITTTPNTYNWEEVGGGPTVVQTTGTSRTDVMSQNAVTSMFFADPIFQTMIQIGSGARVPLSSQYSLALGANADAAGNHPYSVALGAYSIVSSRGEVAIGLRSTSTDGYNNSAYRLLTGLYDPQSAHDAANKEYVDNLAVTYAALNGTAAPTTATAGTYVGQLYLDTTNDKMYYLSAIDTTIPEYTWAEIGGGPNVVQTTGTSTTDVMSQNAVTGMIYADPSTPTGVQIGNNARNLAGNGGTVVGNNSIVASGNNGGTALGGGASVVGAGAIAISGGWNAALANAAGAISIGGGTNTLGRGAISIGFFTPINQEQGKIEVGTTGTNYGYNNSNYRLLTGLYDPQSDHDAATKGYVDTAVAGAGVTKLTSADYNWPVDNPDGVAQWLLDPGYYECGEAIKIYYNTGSSGTTSTAKFWVLKGSDNRVVTVSPSGGMLFLSSIAANGSSVGEPYNNAIVLTASQVVNSLISTSAYEPLSAAQGKVLNDKIGGDLSNLTTTDKTSLIAAINELNTNLGSVNTALQTLLNGTGA